MAVGKCCDFNEKWTTLVSVGEFSNATGELKNQPDFLSITENSFEDSN